MKDFIKNVQGNSYALGTFSRERESNNNNSFSQHHRLTRPKMETTSGHVQSKQVHAIAILLNQIRLELNMLLQDKSISTRMCANIKEDSGLTLQY